MMRYPDLFRVAVANSPNGVLLADDGGQVLFTNPTLNQMFGFAPDEELAGTRANALLPGVPLFDAVLAIAGAAAQDVAAPITCRVEARRKDGGRFPVDVVVVPCSDEGRPMALLSVVDGTHQRNLETAVNRNADFEALIAEVAASFVNIPPDQVDDRLIESLGRVAAAI